MTFRENRAAAARVVADIQAAGGTAHAVQADTSSELDVIAAFDAAQQIGTLTALVANAGIVVAASRVDELESERVQRLLAVNVFGTIICCREAVRRLSMRRGGPGGSIVLLSSTASQLGAAGEYVDYAASKGAIDSLGVGLAREVAEEGIRVNVLRPGVVDTEIHATSGNPGRAKALGPSIPLGRPGQPEEIAAAAVWLLGTGASYCTGAILDVSGGR